MPDLNDIAVFVRVAQLGSFSRAAHALSMPVSTVSRRVSDLEAELGVTLLQRTTRKLSLTALGRAYLDQCGEPLNMLYEAERVLTESQREPQGFLKISVPVALSQEPFLEFISAFLKTYPRIQIELFITNLFLDLVAENIDLGIRFGALKDSSLVVRKLGTTVRYLVAAPEYLKGRQPPRSPEDLAQHECVMLNAKNNETEWELVNGRKRVAIRVTGPISSRDFQSVSMFTYRGHGIGLLPSTYCDEQIGAKTLVRLLPDWSSPPIDLHAVYPTRRYIPSKLQVFLEALKVWKSPLWQR